MRLLPPKNVLFIDTATSDNQWRFDEPHEKGFSDDNQPHMVRLAWALESDGEDGGVLRHACHLVALPEAVHMVPEHAMRIAVFEHQIDARGVPMIEVMTEFFEALNEASIIVAHNWRLHRLVLERSMRLVGLNHERWNHKAHCMKCEGGHLVGIQGAGGPGTFKEPSFFDITELVMGSLPMVSTDPVAEGMSRIDRLRAFYHELQRTKKAG
jgi:hypothetical protein